MSEPKDYRVNISIEPWDGPCREHGNVFTLEEAEIIAEILGRKRAKLSIAMLAIPKPPEANQE
jgi:hypothetical protein